MHRFGIFASLLLAAPLPMALAQPFPSAPVKLVVPFAPAGGTDAVARAVAQSLGKQLGQSVIVENRPGAAGALGSLAVVRAPADGYTLLLGSNGPIAISPSLDPKLLYDPARDLRPVAAVASVPFMLVANRNLPANDVKGLVELARRKPGAINFASPGTGTTNHLVGELLKTMAKVEMVHIPYKGASPAMNDVASGVVQFMSGDINTLLPMIQGGRLKPLAVTGATRSSLVPDVPTVAESGIAGFEATGWFGLFAPAATPGPAVDKLAAAAQATLADPDTRRRIAQLGVEPGGLDRTAFLRFFTSQYEEYGTIVRQLGIKVD